MDRIVEIFKPMTYKGMKTKYFISDMGRIMNSKGKIRKTHITKSGYEQIHIRINNKDYSLKVHRLVAEAFIENYENKPTVNHIKSGIISRSINDVTNLEYATQKEQVADTLRKGSHIGFGKGELNPSASHTSKQIHEVCRLLERNELSRYDISKLTGVSVNVIQKITSKKSWVNISSLYNISNYTIGVRYADSLKSDIISLYNKGKTFSEICEELNLPKTNKIRCLYYQLTKKYNENSSTTIENDEYYTIDIH